MCHIGHPKGKQLLRVRNIEVEFGKEIRNEDTDLEMPAKKFNRKLWKWTNPKVRGWG